MAVRLMALIDAKFESKRNAEKARCEELVKAILKAKEQAAAFTVDAADIFDTYRYIKKHDKEIAEKLWCDICRGCNEYGVEFANAYPIECDDKRTWVFKSKGIEKIVVSRNAVVIRHSDDLLHDLDINTLSSTDAEQLLTSIMKFNDGFPKYVEHFFKMVENI